MPVIGQMRYKLEFYSATIERGTAGAPKPTWTLTTTLRAELKSTAGNKLVDNNEKFNTRQRQFIVYFRDSIVETMRIKFQGEWYRILSIDPVGYREGLIINTELINE